MTPREKFEQLISNSPYERSLERHPADSTAWPGQYVDYHVEFAWGFFKIGYSQGRSDATAIRETENSVRF